jgi:hypothetical protein
MRPYTSAGSSSNRQRSAGSEAQVQQEWVPARGLAVQEQVQEEWAVLGYRRSPHQESWACTSRWCTHKSRSKRRKRSTGPRPACRHLERRRGRE